MLKSIQLENFQDHEQTNIKFDPMITVITGNSNSGKTAIIRGLEWVRTSRPRGNAMIRHGSNGNCKVVITVSDVNEEQVTRVKSKKINRFIVGNTTLNAVGANVPNVVQDIINLNDINIQRQLSSPFMIMDAPGQVAKIINSAISLDDMTACQREASKRLNKATTTLEQTKNHVTDTKQAIKVLSPQVKKMASLVAACKKARVSLNNVAVTIKKLRSKIEDVKKIKSLLQDINIVAITEVIVKCGILVSNHDIVEKLQSRIEDVKKAKKRISNINVTTVIEVPARCETLINSHVMVKTLIRLIHDGKQAFQAEKEAEHTSVRKISDVGRKLNGAICPTCNRTIDIDTLEHILE